MHRARRKGTTVEAGSEEFSFVLSTAYTISDEQGSKPPTFDRFSCGNVEECYRDISTVAWPHRRRMPKGSCLKDHLACHVLSRVNTDVLLIAPLCRILLSTGRCLPRISKLSCFSQP